YEADWCCRSRMETANAAGDASAARFRALLDVVESIATCRGVDELFRHLGANLQHVVRFDRLGLALLQRNDDVMRARVLETSGAGVSTVAESRIAGTHRGW